MSFYPFDRDVDAHSASNFVELDGVNKRVENRLLQHVPVGEVSLVRAICDIVVENVLNLPALQLHLEWSDKRLDCLFDIFATFS